MRLNLEHRNGRQRSVSWGGKIVLVALFAILVMPTLLAGPTAAVQSKAQPALLAVAAEKPEAEIRIIAQLSEAGGDADALVSRFDGSLINDLSMINAFSARMSAANAAQLASSRAVRWVSLDGPVAKSDSVDWNRRSTYTPITYLNTVNARAVWDMGYRGAGITIAIIDSGINHKDLDSRVVSYVGFNGQSTSKDLSGHGTHVAGIAAGDGHGSDHRYRGIAPWANLVDLNVTDGTGMAYESDIVAAMQWVFDNKDLYNIRVVNLSVNDTEPSSYHQSAMDAAAEILWFNGVVVVASAGNSGDSQEANTIAAAPANDPFVITVGATDEQGTSGKSDDVIASFSASGWTLDNSWKPDIFAPGAKIVSTLPNDSSWRTLFPDRTISIWDDGINRYFRASGTSMSAPMVSGAAALLLNAQPNLTPDQVKARLTQHASDIDGYPYLDILAAVTADSTDAANTGVEPSRLLLTGSDPIAWNSVSWNSVSWNSVSWNSVSWNSISWNSISWNSVSWDE